MKIRKIKIRNIAGIEEFEVDPSRAINLIEGKNAQGKTSILNAILSVVGGYDARLVRQGSDHGEVVLVLDDDTEIHKTIRSCGGGTTKAWKPGVGPIGSPATHVKGLVDIVSANPISLLSAKPQDRVRALVRLLPDDVTGSVSKKLKESGLEVVGADTVLDMIDAAERLATEQRRESKSALAASESNTKSVRDMIDDVRSQVAGSPEEIRGKIKALADQANEEIDRHAARAEEIRSEWVAEVEKINAKFQSEKDALHKEQTEKTEATARGLRGDVDKELEGLRASIRDKTDEREKLMSRVRELDKEIASAKGEVEGSESFYRSQLDSRLQEIKLDHDRRLSSLSRWLDDALETKKLEKARVSSEEKTTHSNRMDKIHSELSELKSQATICERLKSLEEIEEKSIAKDKALACDVQGKESVVAFVRSLREETVKDLGVDDLSIVDGDIAIGGIPFPQLSHSERVSLAIKLSTRRTGDLSVICVDGLEALDDETFEELRSQVEDADLQVFATRVGAGNREWRKIPS